MTMATVTEANREEWLAERMKGIGSSDASAVLGINPWKTPLGVYLEKIGQGVEVPQNDAMRWGLRLEPIISEAYSEATGRGMIGEQLFVRSPQYDWLISTLDRVAEDGRIVELKAVGRRQADEWGEAGTDEVPRWYAIQVLHQMAASGRDLADVAALICGQELRIYHLERDDHIIGTMVEREAEFWDRVVRRDPPVIDPDRDAKLMVKLFPEAAGSINLGGATAIDIDDWDRLRVEIKDREDQRERARTAILMAMGNNAIGHLPDGRAIKRSVSHIAGGTFERKPYDKIDLRFTKGGDRG